MLPIEDSLPAESDVRANWHQGEPVLSIICLSYNHADFIWQTLTGFVIQRTTFPFEIICYDDLSTDKTRSIIEYFHQRYPSIIRLIFPNENKYSKGVRPVEDIVKPECKGRFVATCEGDDYWTDPLKVQKQVTFLQQHPDYVLTTHDVHAVDEKGQVIATECLAEFYKADFSSKDLIHGWAGPKTQAMLFRNVISEYPPEFRNCPYGDVFLNSLLGQFGGSKYMADIKPSVYRLHSDGIFSPLSISEKVDMQAQCFLWISRYYHRIGKYADAKIYRIKALEKYQRELNFLDFIKLSLVRFFNFKIKKLFHWRIF